MKSPGALLFILFIAGLSIAVASSNGGAPALQAFVLVSFAVIGLLAVVLVSKSLQPVATMGGAADRFGGSAAIRRLLDGPAAVRSGGGTPAIEARAPSEMEDEADLLMDEAALARRLLGRIAATPPGMQAGTAVGRTVLAGLVREGENLRLLARLLRIDLTSYRAQMEEGLAAAARKRFDECAELLRIANDRLRETLEFAFAEQLTSLRPRPLLERIGILGAQAWERPHRARA